MFYEKTKKKDIVRELKISLEKNDSAIDYLTNLLNRKKDLLMYKEVEAELEQEIADLEYSIFVLKYVGDQYLKTLGIYGVCV